MVQLTPGGIGSPLRQYCAKFKTELKSRDLFNFNGGAEHAALGLVVLPVLIHNFIFHKLEFERNFLKHSSVSSQELQPNGQMLALHSPVEGFVAFTVQEPES